MNKITIALAARLHRRHGIVDEFGMRHPHRRGRGAARRQRSAPWFPGGFGWNAAHAAAGRYSESLGNLSFRRALRCRGVLPHRPWSISSCRTISSFQREKRWPRRFLKGAPLALRYIKEAIYKGSEMTLDQGLRYESDLQSMVMQTEDAKEGPRAFVEKRPANWKGK